MLYGTEVDLLMCIFHWMTTFTENPSLKRRQVFGKNMKTPSPVFIISLKKSIMSVMKNKFFEKLENNGFKGTFVLDR